MKTDDWTAWQELQVKHVVQISSISDLFFSLIVDVDVDVVCRRRLKASLPASKIQY